MKQRIIILLLGLLFSNSAMAASSACVVYVSNSGGEAAAQYSCDGGDLADLFTSSGITAAISKAIPHFMDLGYTHSGCTDSYSEGPNNTSGTAYSRCVFIKK